MRAVIMKYSNLISYIQELCRTGLSYKRADIQAQAIENIKNTINEMAQSHGLITTSSLTVSLKELELKLIKWLLATVLKHTTFNNSCYC